ncbi:MAG: LysR substrate-binding domain-containing protein [Aeromicrobium erythreum]
MALTEAGRALARAATDIAVAIERAEGEWRAFMEQPAGRVTLVTFPTGGEMLLPGLLTRMAERPDVELVCTDTEDPDAVGDLTADHDVVLSDSPTTSAAWHDRGLQVVPLMSEPLDVALPQDHTARPQGEPVAARRRRRDLDRRPARLPLRPGPRAGGGRDRPARAGRAALRRQRCRRGDGRGRARPRDPAALHDARAR